MRAAMRRQPTPRIPTMPQTTHDLALRIYAEDFGGDFIEGLRRAFEDPSIIYDYAIRLAEDTDCDGLRLFVRPEPMKTRRQGEDIIVVDAKGDRLGKVDIHGGGHLVPDKPAPTIETIEEARVRLDAIVAGYSDEKMDLLRQARARIPNRFVAGAPGGITMNTYTILRGREQAMMDLVDRPDFVHAVMDMQAEAMIKNAEKLVTTGVDVLYIGDPASSASLISPRHFETFCLPAYQKFCKHMKRYHDILIYIHICGNSAPILEMMADTGADCVEPLDPLGGVKVADAKRRIGHRVCIMGGVNTLTLAQETPEDVRAEAERCCRDGGPHGYVLAAGDMVPPLTTRANLQALVDVARTSSWRTA